MKEIQLTQGKVAMVDDEDYEFLNQFNWYAHSSSHKLWYAHRMVTINGEKVTVNMHRNILAVIPKGCQVDHINGDGLDNRRSNLRLCTWAQNNRNRGASSNNTSGYKGVHWHKNEKRWHANIRYDNKKHFIGAFTDKESAAHAYNEAALKYHGEFAYLNAH